MKKHSMITALARVLGIITLTLLACALTASAGTVTWTGGSGNGANWNDSANWSPAIPVAGDSVMLQDFAQQVNTNDLPSLSLTSLIWNNGGFETWWPGITNVPMVSTNVITITGGVTNVNGDNTMHCTIALGGPVAIESQTADTTLTLSGGLTLGANPGLWTGAGNHILTGPLTGTGNPALVKQGAGTLSLNNGNSYSGTLFVNAGTVSLKYGWDNPSVVGNVSVASGATLQFNSHPYSYSTVNWTTNAGTIVATGDNHVPNLVLTGGGTVTGGSVRLANIWGTGGNYISLASPGMTNSIYCTTLALYANGNFTVGAGGNDVDLDISAAINQSGTHGIIKNGLGTMQLSGICNYAGDTLINAGKLILINSGSIGNSALIKLAANTTLDVTSFGGSWGLSANQTLAGVGVVLGGMVDLSQASTYIAPGGVLSAGTLSLSNTVILSGYLQLKMDLASSTTEGAGVNDLLVVSNLVTYGSQTTVDFAFLNGQPVNGGTYTLIKYQEFDGNESSFVAAPSAYTFTFINDTVNKAIKVTVTGTPTSLTWQGDGVNNFWDINTTQNWLNGANPTVYLDGNLVTFNDAGSAVPNINLQSVVQPGSVTVTGTKDYTFEGAGYISAGGSVTKSGSGTLTFLTANDFSGPLTVSGGTVKVGTNGTVGALGTGYTTNNSKVVFSRSDTYSYLGTMVGSGTTIISNGTVQLGSSSASTSGNILTPVTNYTTLAVARGDTPVVPGPIVGGTINLAGGASARFGTVIGSFMGVGTSGGVAANLAVGSGDSLTVSDLYTGQGGGNLGNINQTGGTINVTDGADTEGPLRLGHWGSATSYYNMSGGTLYITNGSGSRFSIGIDGNGIWNMSGGTANVNLIAVNGRYASGGGTLNVTNGTINVGPGGITGTAPYTMNLVGGTLGSLSSWSCGLTGTLATAGNQVTFDTSTNTITYSGVLTGPGGLVKQGAGTLALTGTDSFTGTATVSNGTLIATSLSGPVVVQSNGVLSAGAVLTPAVLGITNNLTLNGGAGLTFDLGNTNTLGGGVNDLIVVQTNLNLSGNIPVTLNFLGFPYTAGPYVLITNIGSQSGSATFFATNNQTRYTAAFSTTANKVQVSLSGTGANLVWKGDGSANLWNVVGAANWLNGASASQFYQADAVTFDDSTANTTANLSGTLSPITTTVSITNNNYLLAGTGKISGPTGITKNGPGKLTVATDNDFIGPMVVNAGTVQIGNAGGTGSFATTLVTNNAAMVYSRTNAQTISYVTYGTGVMYKENTNTLSTGANQQCAGGIVVNNGTLRWTSGAFGGSKTANYPITINTNGAMLTDSTHAPGVGTPLFINRGTYYQNYEDYRSTLTMVDGLIATGGGGNGGQVRFGYGGGTSTLNVSNSIAGSVINLGIVNYGTVSLNVTRGAAASDLTFSQAMNGNGTAGTYVQNGNGIVTFAATNNYAGNTTVNGGTLRLSATALLTNTATMTLTSPGVLDVSANGLTLGVSRAQTLAGNGTVQGGFTVGVGGIVAPGTTTVPNTLVVNGTVTFNSGTNLAKVLKPGVTGGGVNDLLQITGGLNVADGTVATIVVSPYSALVPGTYTIITYTGSRAGTGTFVAAATLPTLYTLSVDESEAGKVKLVVGGSNNSLVWYGGQTGNAWDVANTPNWNVNANVFYSWDAATFNDTSSSQYVNVTVPVTPISMTVSGTLDYLFGGASKITGAASLTKAGTGTLTVTNANDFSGPVTISGGTVQVGLGTNAGWLGSGPITNNARLVFNRSDSYTLGSTVSGAGQLVKLGANTLTVSAADTYTGGTTISNGAVTIGNGATAGSLSGSITNYASLNYSRSDAITLANPIYGTGGLTLYTPAGFTVDGTAPINIGGTLTVNYNAYSKLLVNSGANITVGAIQIGNPGGWGGEVVQSGGSVTSTATGSNFRIGHWSSEISTYTMNNGTLSVAGSLNVGWDGIGLLTLNNGTITTLALSVDSNGATPAINGTNSTFTLLGGTINIGGTGIAKSANGLIYLGGGTVGSYANWSSAAAMTLSGTNGSVTFNTGTFTNTLTGMLSGAGGLNKTGAGTLFLNAANAFQGSTLVSGGMLIGNGTLAGPLTVQSGGTFTPGVATSASIGALTVTNTVTFSTGGTVVMEISKANNVLTNDQVIATGAINYGGTLTVVGLGGAYVANDTFKLFTSGTSTYGGTFNTLNLPANVVWDTTQLGVNGTIRVVSVSKPAITGTLNLGLGGFQLSLSGPAGNNYRVWATNNVAAPLATWPVIYTNIIGPAGTATFTDTAATNYPTRIYDITVP
jgi:fibronectin-binding autotransporter adhesin